MLQIMYCMRPLVKQGFGRCGSTPARSELDRTGFSTRHKASKVILFGKRTKRVHVSPITFGLIKSPPWIPSHQLGLLARLHFTVALRQKEVATVAARTFPRAAFSSCNLPKVRDDTFFSFYFQCGVTDCIVFSLGQRSHICPGDKMFNQGDSYRGPV